MVIRKGYRKRFDHIDPLSCIHLVVGGVKVGTLHTSLKELDIDYESASKMMHRSNHMSGMQVTNWSLLVMSSPRNLRYK